jgi:hypothetical protein
MVCTFVPPEAGSRCASDRGTRARAARIPSKGAKRCASLLALARVAEQASPEQRLKVEERMREQARHMAYRIAEVGVV